MNHLMPNNTFEDIARIHSYSSMMDKMARIAYLQGEWKRLDDIAFQLGRSYQAKGYFTPEEQQSANHILQMMDAVQSEGQRLQSEFSAEWWNEWRKEVAKAIMNMHTR